MKQVEITLNEMIGHMKDQNYTEIKRVLIDDYGTEIEFGQFSFLKVSCDLCNQQTHISNIERVQIDEQKQWICKDCKEGLWKKQQD